jgi:hypothetical protein
LNGVVLKVARELIPSGMVLRAVLPDV